LAAIHIDGSLQNWAPNTLSGVNSVVISGNILYVGGNFWEIEGEIRDRLGAIDISPNCLNSWSNFCASGGDPVLSWNPSASFGVVKAVTIANGIVYAGGSFSQIDGITRLGIAAIGVDGTLQSWDPNLNDAVKTIAYSGNSIYAGGVFSILNAVPRNYLAAIGTEVRFLVGILIQMER
jgi:hypothetical protein